MLNRCLVFFVEGDTEIEFYKKMIGYIFNKHKIRNIKVEYRNVSGVGGFKKEALSKFKRDIKTKSKYKGCKFIIVLCRDTDVDEFAGIKPDFLKIEESFRKDKTVLNVIHLEAEKCIEDWFLLDKDSILKFLKLSNSAKIKGTNGFEKLKLLFKKSNKVYVKGKSSSDLISHLNFDIILKNIEFQLRELYKELGIDRKL